MARYYVQKAGLTAGEDVTILAVGTGTSMMAALDNRLVDAVVDSTAALGEAVDQGLAVIVVSAASGEDPDLSDYLQQLIVVRPDYARDHPEVGARVVRAIVRGNRWVAEHSAAEIADLLREDLGQTPSDFLVQSVKLAVPADGRMTQHGVGDELRDHGADRSLRSARPGTRSSPTSTCRNNQRSCRRVGGGRRRATGGPPVDQLVGAMRPWRTVGTAEAPARAAQRRTSIWPRYDAAVLGFRNYWYPVMWSRDLKRKPVARTLLGERVMLVRERGKAHALFDQCPHRGVPLSIGRQDFPGTWSCRYHGWCFDLQSGICGQPSPTDRTRRSEEGARPDLPRRGAWPG